MASPWKYMMPWISGARWTDDEVYHLGFNLKVLQCLGFQDIQVFEDDKIKTI